MSFNPDSNRQAQEVIFSRKTAKKIHSKIVFNNTLISKADSGLLRNFQQLFPKPSLITI